MVQRLEIDMVASKIQVTDQIVIHGRMETVTGITPFEGGVMLFLDSEVGNPFVSSTFASFNNDAEIEVV